MQQRFQAFVQALSAWLRTVFSSQLRTRFRSLFRFLLRPLLRHCPQWLQAALLLAFELSAGCVGAFFFVFALASAAFPLNLDVPYSQVLLDRTGAPLHAFLSPDDKWRMKTELAEISPTLRAAIVCKEDRWFAWHFGVNPVAVLRAALTNLLRQKITSGASTITMQVARMLEDRHGSRYENRNESRNESRFRNGAESRSQTRQRPRTAWNKLVETFRALQLEARLSKHEILQLYLNLAPYGSNIEGVKAASMLYFGQSPERLSLAQATTLAVIPNRPTSLNLDGNADALRRIEDARNQWLRRFQASGAFSATDVADALREPLVTFRNASNAITNASTGSRTGTSTDSRTDSRTRRDVPTAANSAIPHVALRIQQQQLGVPLVRTTLDAARQARVQSVVANKMRRLALRGIYNAAVLVVETRTRRVVAYLGSPNFADKAHFGEVDGVRAVRSPGSALKPLIYGMALDKGIITPKTVLTDVPINLGGYAPENFDRRYRGAITAEQALVNSLNVPAVKLASELGVTTIVERLKQAGFEQIRRDERKLGLSLVLGGCGVRLDEMVALYAAFADGGVYKPLQYTLPDPAESTANVSASTATALTATALLSPAAAFMLSDILTQLTRPDVPNRNAFSSVMAGRLPRVAWKTGTSYGRRDAWSIGYNPRYTVGVWVGNFSGQGTPELVGADIATPLLFEIFHAIDYNSAGDWFAPPARGLDFRLVCSESGAVPNDFCENQVTDYYVPSVSSNKRCEHLKPVLVSMDETMSYTPDCLPHGSQNGTQQAVLGVHYKRKLYPNLPPELIALYTQEHYDFVRIPERSPACKELQSAARAAPVITSLVSGKEYLVERTTSADTKNAGTKNESATNDIASELLLACTSAGDVQTVYWYVNDRFFRAAKPHERLFFKPERGTVKISCSDDKGATTHVFVHVAVQ
jgi:penicillin-binding protein 1C